MRYGGIHPWPGRTATRRRVLGGAAAWAATASAAVTQARAQNFSSERTPILLLHGGGGTAAQWIPTIWRLESNFYPRARIFAADLRLSSARVVDTVRAPGRSSSEEATAQVTQEIARVLRAANAERLFVVAQGRAGNLVRNHMRLAGSPQIRLAVLCAPPSHGAIISDTHMVGSEYNGHTRFLRLLNAQPGGIAPGANVVTLASDGKDLYAQPDGRFLGLPGVETGIGFDSPALKGATNLVLQDTDHLETAFSSEAFVSIWRAITGEPPQSQEVHAEVRPVFNGRITGWEGGVPTNTPLSGARLRVFPVNPASGLRLGDPIHTRTTTADGVWGPMDGDPEVPLEFAITARGYPTTHIYRAPLRRSTEHLHLRPHLPTPADLTAGTPPGAPPGTPPGALVLLTRVSGFFDYVRDAIMLNGQRVDGAPDVPHESTLRLALPADGQRPVPAEYNGERIVGATWPMAERHVTVLEITG